MHAALRRTAWASRAGRLLAWAVVLAAGCVMLLVALLPRLTGAQTYTVLTGSMQPRIPPGSLVVVRPVEPERVGVGSVITYQLHSGEPTVVTHRVVSSGVGVDGSRIFRTQGDANPVPDREWVKPVQVRGEVWYAVPFVGRINELVPAEVRARALLVVVLGLFGYAAVMLGAGARDALRHA